MEPTDGPLFVIPYGMFEKERVVKDCYYFYANPSCRSFVMPINDVTSEDLLMFALKGEDIRPMLRNIVNVCSKEKVTEKLYDKLMADEAFVNLWKKNR